MADRFIFTEQNSHDWKNSFCHGWILYTKEESGRNRYYIDLYRLSCRRHAASIELVIYDEKTLWTPEKEQALTMQILQHMPDFVVNRTRDYRLAALFEKAGITVYNNSNICRFGNNKAAAYRYMEQCGIPVMPVIYGLETPSSYPVVIKAAAGHGGTEVFLIKNKKDWRQWEREHYKSGKAYLMQKVCSDLGKDVRVYVVGGRIIKSILRTCTDDFRSNYSLGGSAEVYELKQSERELVQAVISKFQTGFVGIDFIFHEGRMIFNEIEDMVGARMLYAITDIDIVEIYVRYILQEEKRGRKKNM